MRPRETVLDDSEGPGEVHNTLSDVPDGDARPGAEGHGPERRGRCPPRKAPTTQRRDGACERPERLIVQIGALSGTYRWAFLSGGGAMRLYADRERRCPGMSEGVRRAADKGRSVSLLWGA